jgi:hypothetical protein
MKEHYGYTIMNNTTTAAETDQAPHPNGHGKPAKHRRNYKEQVGKWIIATMIRFSNEREKCWKA